MDQVMNQEQIMAELATIKAQLAELMKDKNERTEPTEIANHGIKYWTNNKGQLHRDGDLPAVEDKSGNKDWYQHGQLHRENDLPARIDADGSQHWYQHGKLHRDTLDQNGCTQPAREYSSGDKVWYQHGQQHRTDGPAVEQVNGYQVWYDQGKRHRSDGQPAIIRANGEHEWWEHGVCIKKLLLFHC